MDIPSLTSSEQCLIVPSSISKLLITRYSWQLELHLLTINLEKKSSALGIENIKTQSPKWIYENISKIIKVDIHN